jgi:hypothetical protein
LQYTKKQYLVTKCFFFVESASNSLEELGGQYGASYKTATITKNGNLLNALSSAEVNFEFFCNNAPFLMSLFLQNHRNTFELEEQKKIEEQKKVCLSIIQPLQPLSDCCIPFD